MLSLEPVVATVGGILQIAFFLAIALFLFMVWRERRGDLEAWSEWNRKLFYAAVVLAVVAIGLAIGYGVPGSRDAFAFVVVLGACAYVHRARLAHRAPLLRSRKREAGAGADDRRRGVHGVDRRIVYLYVPGSSCRVPRSACDELADLGGAFRIELRRVRHGVLEPHPVAAVEVAAEARPEDPRFAAERVPKRRYEGCTGSSTPGQRVIDPPVVRSSDFMTRGRLDFGVPST